MLTVLEFICWTICGIVILTSDEITKLEYGLCWGGLLIHIIAKIMRS